MKHFITIASILLLSTISQAAEPEDSFLGIWSDGSQTLAFYGSSIGQQGSTYLQVSFSGSDQLTFTYGEESSAVYTYSFVEGSLHLNDGTTTTIYTQQSSSSGICACNLHQVAGAKALFALDHPKQGQPTMADLMSYLSGTVPACPGGGLYTFADGPVCSVCGVL